jgi:Flp pilus assembly protein TadG
MSKELFRMNRSRDDRLGERGQILVLFTIAIVVIIAMLGLVLDGGSAFAQRREQQNVADVSALAGATAYLNTNGSIATKSAAAQSAALSVALANGHTTDVRTGENVTVNVDANAVDAHVTVIVTQPHNNNFVGLIGMPTWGVSAQATAEASAFPNGATGAMPLLFNAKAFPGAICNKQVDPSCAGALETYQLPCTPTPECKPGTGNEDVPQDATQFNWTIFCEANGNTCNGDARGIRDIINSNGADSCTAGGITRSPCTVFMGDALGPLDSGDKASLFDDLRAHVGEEFPVPIVDDSGAMVGWGYFHLVATQGTTSDKWVQGYFVSPINADQLVVGDGPGATLPTGVYVLRLSN